MTNPQPPSSTSLERALAESLLEGGLLRSDVLEAVPEAIGRYEILRRLGQGAQAEVYLGRDPAMDREVAIKRVFGASFSAERFKRECVVLGRLNHPNVVQVYDAGVDAEGTPFYVMEHLEGRTLADVSLTPDEAVDVVAQVARGCQAAHELGIVHRDLKPANVILADRPVVVDFGVAKRLDDDLSTTQTGAAVGTPVYMAPEQIAGAEVDARTDVYALGVVLYEALCGELPYAESMGSGFALAVQIAQGQLVSLQDRAAGISPRLVAVVERALATEPAARYPSAAELAHALEGLARGATAPPQPPWRRMVGAAVLGAALLVGLVWATREGEPEPGPSVARPSDPPGPQPTEHSAPGPLDLAATAAFYARDVGEAPVSDALTLAEGSQTERDVAAILLAVGRSEREGGQALLRVFPELLRVFSEQELGAPARDALAAYTQRLILHVLDTGAAPSGPEVANACLRLRERLRAPQRPHEEVTHASLRVLTALLGSNQSGHTISGLIQEAVGQLKPAANAGDRLAQVSLLHVLLLRAGIRKRLGREAERLLGPARVLLGTLRDDGWPRAELLGQALAELER